MKKQFTPKRFLTSFIIASMVCITSVSLTNSGGAGGGNSNAPGENNCTQCHSGSLQTSGTNYNNISLSSNFTGNGYIPDSTYTITFSYTHTGKTRFGYQLTCLDANNAMAGSFSTISGNNKSSITSATISGGSRSYMRQTSSGNSGSGSISWQFRWTAPSTNVGDVKFYSVVNSTNSNGGTGGDIVIARDFTISPSTLLPEATAGASNNAPCQGSLIGLTGSGTNTPTAYSWNLSGGSPSTSNVQNPNVVYNFPGTYKAILTVTNAKGVSAPDTTTIVVKSAPSAFILGGATRTICEGDSVQLSTSFDPTYTYTWSNGESSNAIWVKDTGDYNVSVVGNNGCGKQSNTVKVKYYDKPTVTLSSSASIFNDSSCVGSALELEAGSATFDSFYYYENGSLVAATDSSKQMVSFNANTEYGLQVRNATGCLSDTVFYTVSARDRMDAPVITCTATTPSSIEFTWTSVGAHMGYQVSTNGTSWSAPSSGTLSNKHLIIGLQPDDSVTLYVRAFDNAPCDFSLVGEKKCFTESCVQLSATVTAEDSICRGDLWTIEVNGLANESFGLSLDGGTVFTDTIFSFNPSASRTYTLSVQDSANLVCPALPIQIPLVVDNIHDIQLKTDKLGSYCQGEKIIFSANDSIENFSFYLNETLVQSGSSSTYESTMFNNKDSVYVIVTKGKCTDTSLNNYVQIEVPADVGFTHTRQGSVYTFMPDNSTYATYAWDFGDGSSISNDVSPMHDYASAEGTTVNASLEVVTDNNCVNDSTQSIDLPMFSNVQDFLLLGLEVYPNPVEDVLTLKNTSAKPMKVGIYNISGELILEQEINLSVTSIDVNHLDAGVYLLKVVSNGNESSMRIIKK